MRVTTPDFGDVTLLAFLGFIKRQRSDPKCTTVPHGGPGLSKAADEDHGPGP